MCDTKMLTVPSDPSTSCELMEEQKQRPYKADDPTTIPDGHLHKLMENLRAKQVAYELKRLTGPTWLSLISTNVYTWKCLVLHT